MKIHDAILQLREALKEAGALEEDIDAVEIFLPRTTYFALAHGMPPELVLFRSVNFDSNVRAVVYGIAVRT